MNGIPKKALRKQFLSLLPVYINIFMIGCHAGWSSNAIYYFQQGVEVTATTTQFAIMVSNTELACIIFSIPAGILVDVFGRKKIIISIGVLNSLSWLTLCFGDEIVVYIVRFFVGITLALSNASTSTYIGEIASPEVRGKFSCIRNIFFAVGILSQSITSIIFLSYYKLAYTAAAFSLVFFAFTDCIVETPNYLISVSKLEQSKRNMNYIRSGYSEIDIRNEYDNLEKYIRNEEQRRKSNKTFIHFMKSSSIRTPLMIASALNFCITMSGIGVIILYATVIFPADGIVPQYYYPLLSQISRPIVLLCTTFYIDKLPRRTIYLIGSALFSIAMALCAITNFGWTKYDDDVCKWMFFFGNIILSIIFNGSMLPVSNAVNTELLPQAIKGLGASIISIIHSIAHIILYQLYYLIGVPFGIYYMYSIFCVHSLTLFTLIYLLLPEGRGKFLADLQMEFRDKIPPLGTEICASKNNEAV